MSCNSITIFQYVSLKTYILFFESFKTNKNRHDFLHDSSWSAVWAPAFGAQTAKSAENAIKAPKHGAQTALESRVCTQIAPEPDFLQTRQGKRPFSGKTLPRLQPERAEWRFRADAAQGGLPPSAA